MSFLAHRLLEIFWIMNDILPTVIVRRERARVGGNGSHGVNYLLMRTLEREARVLRPHVAVWVKFYFAYPWCSDGSVKAHEIFLSVSGLPITGCSATQNSLPPRMRKGVSDCFYYQG